MNDHEIYQSVINLLLKDKFLPGQRISADKIAEMLNTSHTPIRESLSALSRDEIVIRRPGQGFFMPIYTENEISNLYDFLYILLSAALHKLMLDRSKKEIELILEENKIIENIDDIEACSDENQFRYLMEKLFMIVSQSSNNKLIVNSMNSCVIKTSYLRKIEYSDKSRCISVRDDVMKIFDCLNNANKTSLKRKLLSSHNNKNTILNSLYNEYAVELCKNSHLIR